MSSYRSFLNDEQNRNRDPRRRDRSRSEIRRSDNSNILPNQSINHEEISSTNSILDFFKTLGINSQLIQALINANPPKIEQIQSQQIVNNTQEFASFLSQNYGLNSSINRDPRCRPIDPRLILPNNNNNSISSQSIDETYKQFLNSIDQTLLDNKTRQYFQRIALLDNELDKLLRMNNELIKTSKKRYISTKDKDPLLKENENLQNELMNYIKTLKTNLMKNYSIYQRYFY